MGSNQGFAQFLGNSVTVLRLREAVAARRVPPALILAGPRGSGKYTLAVMLAQAMACLEPPVSGGLPDFCGHCRNCSRIAFSMPLGERVSEAVAAREELRETDKKETRILIQTHPDLLVVPPDPPQLMIKIGQVRSVIQRIYRRPAEAPSSWYIFTSASFMKEAANSLLKVLEEPPEHAHIVLLAEHAGEFLPTIRSRSQLFRLGPLAPEEIEELLKERRSDWNARDRALVGKLSEGAVGRALDFNLEAYLKSRQDALLLLQTAIYDESPGAGGSARSENRGFSAIFRVTETYRAGAEGQEKMSGLLSSLRSLLEDLLLLRSGTPELVRNIDIAPELSRISENITLEWIESAARSLIEAEQGMRRNLLRSLSLDSMAVGLLRE